VAVKAATITGSAPRDIPAVGSLPSLFGLAGEDDEEVMRRRAFLMGLAALTGLGAAGPTMALEGTRHRLNLALAERHASTDVEEWRFAVQRKSSCSVRCAWLVPGTYCLASATPKLSFPSYQPCTESGR
jgi:hypothetical protein